MEATLLVIVVVSFIVFTYGTIGIAFKFKSIDNRIDGIARKINDGYLRRLINDATTVTFSAQADVFRKQIDDIGKLTRQYRNGIDLRINQAEIKIKNIEILLALVGDKDLPDLVERIKREINDLKTNKHVFENLIGDVSDAPLFFDIIESPNFNNQMPMYGYGYGSLFSEPIMSLMDRYKTLMTPTPLLEEPQFFEVSNEINLDLAD